MKPLVGFIILFIYYQQTSFAEVPEFLKRWQRSPKEVSAEIPPKRGAAAPLKFSQDDLRNSGFVAHKDKIRLHICELAGRTNCEDPATPLELSADKVLLNQFIGATAETNIFELDHYKSGSAQTIPWSGHYWPFYDGGIGVRFGDQRFPHSQNFSVNFKYYRNNYLKNPRNIKNYDELSPAEKYDLMVNDKAWSLTDASWAVGRRYYQTAGRVETWMGLCHGWAPAAIAIPEPKRVFKVDVPSLNGPMKLYPDDVKALVTQLWASARIGATFIGSRCDDKKPRTDSQGRILKRDCFDTNPATWHIALLNHLGRMRKSFIFDATYDFEVWNQPIASYTLRYFNPKTRHVTSNLKSAMIPYLEFTNDRYRKYRTTNVQNIVGVQMNLNYVVERLPNLREMVGQPRVTQVTYYYDLELDRHGEVIGGEWYQNAHPDMLWKTHTHQPRATNEPQDSNWSGSFPIPNELAILVQKASTANQPLSAIVDQLVEWSH